MRRNARRCARAGAAACIAVLTTLSVPGRAEPPRIEGIAIEDAPVALDRWLVDAARVRRRFRDEVVGLRPTTVSFTYSACGATCPVSDLVMDAVEEALARKGRQDVALATLTLDPLTDTPERLRAHAAKVGVGPLQRFYTGAPADVYAVLDGLGMRFGRSEDHAVFFLVFAAGGHAGRRMPSSAGTEELLAAVGTAP